MDKVNQSGSDQIAFEDYCRRFEAMNDFFMSIPNHKRAHLDGDRGIAVWPATTDDILTRGAQFAHDIGLEVHAATSGWTAILPGCGYRNDGTPARTEYVAKISHEWGADPVCIVSYVARYARACPT